MCDWLAPLDAGEVTALLEAIDDDDASAFAHRRESARSMNGSRERRRRELLLLRDQERYLSSQLNTLRTRRAMAEERERKAAASGVLKALPLWERLARRQFLARQQAEALNAELKRAVDQQQEALDDLQHAVDRLHQSATERKNDFMGVSDCPTTIRDRMPVATQQQRLQLIAAKWWAVFSEFGSSKLEFSDVKSVAKPGEIVVCVRSSHAAPFAVPLVEAALWSFLGLALDDESEQIVTHEATWTDTTMHGVVVSLISHDGNDSSGRVDEAFAVEPFYPSNDGTVVVVHTTYGETQGVGPDVDGVAHYQDAWVRLVEAKDPITATPVTVLQHVRHVTITWEREKREAEPIAAFVEGQLRNEMAWMQRTFENLLLGAEVIRSV